MKSIESRITKLEQLNGINQGEIIALLDEQNLNVFEKTQILCDVGIITGEMIAGWIKAGSRKINELEEENG